MALCGVAIAVGYRTRSAAVCFAVVFSYCELIDAALYLNHYVYVTMAALLIAALPVGSMWSLDARAGRVARSATVPAVVVWLLRLQTRRRLPVRRPRQAQRRLALRRRCRCGSGSPTGPTCPSSVRWLDEPAVAYRRQLGGRGVRPHHRVAAAVAADSRPSPTSRSIAFHLSTTMFQIGIFPWVMILRTPIFFDPDWPFVSRGEGTFRSTHRSRPSAASGGDTAKPDRRGLGDPDPIVVASSLPWWSSLGRAAGGDSRPALPHPWRRALDGGGVLRLVPGDAQREGRDGTSSPSPTSTRDRPGEVDPDLVLTEWQEKQAAARPDLLLAAAHLVADHYGERASTSRCAPTRGCRVNGRPRQRMVDPAVDLAAVDRWAPASSYLLPFDPPVRRVTLRWPAGHRLRADRPAARACRWCSPDSPWARATTTRRPPSDDRPPSRSPPPKPTFASLDELVAASDVVVDRSRRRSRSTGGRSPIPTDPEAGIRTQPGVGRRRRRCSPAMTRRRS